MSAGIRSLAVAFPPTVRDNAWFRAHLPDVVARAERESVATPWSLDEAPRSAFDRAMARHLGDPFRGTRVRRVLADDETAHALSLDAARRAIDAAGLATKDVDLAIV